MPDEFHCSHCGEAWVTHGNCCKRGRSKAYKASQRSEVGSMRWMDGGREQARNAFVKLHTQWLGASHRKDMNEGMDEMARALQLDPLTLEPSIEKLTHDCPLCGFRCNPGLRRAGIRIIEWLDF